MPVAVAARGAVGVGVANGPRTLDSSRRARLAGSAAAQSATRLRNRGVIEAARGRTGLDAAAAAGGFSVSFSA